MKSWWLSHVLLCTLGTLLVYGRLLKAPLLYDDVVAVMKNPDVHQPASWALFENDFWGTPLKSNFSHQSYRPLAVLTFRLTGDVFRQRLLNAVLHLANTLAFTRLVRRLAGDRVSRAAAVLFCFHPLQTETVIQLVGRAELLCACFYLGCLSSSSYAIACVCTALAMLCKEHGVTGLAVKASLDVIGHFAGRRDQALWRKLLIATLATAGLLTARLAVSARAPTFHELDNPVRLVGFPLRQINFVYLAVFNVNLILHPHRQSCDYSFRSVPLIENLRDPRVLQVVMFAVIALAVVASSFKNSRDRPRVDSSSAYEAGVSLNNNNNNNNYMSCKSARVRRESILSTKAVLPLSALTMAVVPWVPASNLVFYVGFVIAERILYLPSMGVCFLVAIGYDKLRIALPERRSLLRNAFMTLVGLLLIKGGIRSEQWRSAVQLYGAAVRDYPENIKMWNNLGKAFEMEGDFHLALNCFERSVMVYDDVRAHWYKARLLAKLNKDVLARDVYQSKYPDVVATLRRRSGVRREDILFVVDYVRLLVKLDAFEEAESLLEETLTLAPGIAELYVVAGELFYQLDKKSLAEENYRQALEIDPRVVDVYYNLGVLLMERGATDQAAPMFRRCIELNPTHEASRINLNVLKTNTEDASMMSLYKDAMDAIREGSYTAAESLLHQILSRQPHHPSALYNLALLHTQLGQPPSSSLAFLDRLLADRPSHSKALLLKANIVHQQLHDTETAIKLYAQAYLVDKTLESPLEALCDLSPRTAFSLGGSCHRDVDVEILPQQRPSTGPVEDSQTNRHSDLPSFSRRPQTLV
ncbi:transmembrane and TPR repeat-containing protein 3-like [Tropilaelaps mercedesae]|uniref:dolichyl-phosphate-mannose--protein mannosyltransferase n=1 Tax=Tropilaelaps mercedesae TaxID=418985 RepID=A0A1V9X0D8_9ACAR|nr:transmembrane and TPR repeat-containing protein 3-like [Tropilaelaps mercedesae]